MLSKDTSVTCLGTQSLQLHACLLCLLDTGLLEVFGLAQAMCLAKEFVLVVDGLRKRLNFSLQEGRASSCLPEL